MTGVRIIDRSAKGDPMLNPNLPLVPGNNKPAVPLLLVAGNRYRIMNSHVEMIRSALTEDVLLTTIVNVTTGQREVEIRHKTFADLVKFEDAFNALCDNCGSVLWV